MHSCLRKDRLGKLVAVVDLHTKGYQIGHSVLCTWCTYDSISQHQQTAITILTVTNRVTKMASIALNFLETVNMTKWILSLNLKYSLYCPLSFFLIRRLFLRTNMEKHKSNFQVLQFTTSVRPTVSKS